MENDIDRYTQIQESLTYLSYINLLIVQYTDFHKDFFMDRTMKKEFAYIKHDYWLKSRHLGETNAQVANLKPVILMDLCINSQNSLNWNWNW